MRKNIFKILFRVAVSVGLIAFFLCWQAKEHHGLRNAIHYFWLTFSKANGSYLVMAFSLHFVGFLFVSFRWSILLVAQEVRTKFKNLLELYIKASFFNVFLVSTIGGDSVRVLESKKYTKDISIAFMVVVVERLTGLMALLFISFIGLTAHVVQSGENLNQMIAVILFVFSFFFIIGYALHPNHLGWLDAIQRRSPQKIQKYLQQIRSAIATYYQKPRHFAGVLLVSLLFKINEILYYFFLTKALGHQVPFAEFMLKIPVVLFLLMVVPTLNGIGVRTAGFQGLLGFPVLSALALETIDVGMKMAYGIIGGVFFLKGKKEKRASLRSDNTTGVEECA